MTPLAFVWPWTLVFWAIFFWAFGPEWGIVRRARQPATTAGSPDAGSFRVIMLGMGLASFAAFPLAFVRALQFAPAMRAPMFATGLATLIAGSLLRRHCWRQLGASFTGDVRARSDQTIVRTGAYSILRHPSYTAGTLMNLGIGLALGSWGSALLLTVASLAVYGYRIKVEEAALLAVLGDPYRDYISTRRRMIPFVY